MCVMRGMGIGVDEVSVCEREREMKRLTNQPRNRQMNVAC